MFFEIEANQCIQDTEGRTLAVFSLKFTCTSIAVFFWKVILNWNLKSKMEFLAFKLV